MPIETLDPHNSADVEAVTALHFDLLGDSPIVGLGKRFVSRFFYTSLVGDGAVAVILCRDQGRIVGFISYTPDPKTFMARGIKKHFVYLCWLMSTSLMMSPALIKGVLRALNMVRERSGAQEAHDPRLGEVISLATLPDYRKHVPEGAKSRLSVRLFQEAREAFRKLGYERIHLLVQPNNSASNLLCTAMGCTFDKVTIGGVVTHRFTYHMNGRPEERPTGGAGQ